VGLHCCPVLRVCVQRCWPPGQELLWPFGRLFCPLCAVCLKRSLEQCWLCSHGEGDWAFPVLSTATWQGSHPSCVITSVWPQPRASGELHMLIIYLHSPHRDVHYPCAPRPWVWEQRNRWYLPVSTSWVVCATLALVNPSLSCLESPTEWRCPLICFAWMAFF